MANPEHFTILKRGVIAWNNWRTEDTSFVRPDLSEADLSEMDLSGFNLRDAYLDGANLQGSNLQGATLRGAKMGDSNLAVADLSGADLEYASLNGASLSLTNLSGAKLGHANLTNANMESAYGYIFDKNCIRGLRLSYKSKDPWSVLKRTYTGSNMIFNIMFLIIFTLPYTGRLIFWKAVNEYQTYSRESVPSDHSLCLSSNCEEVSVWKLVLGLDKGYVYAGIVTLLMVYNIFRALLTYKVSLLKDEELQSGHSPPWTARSERVSPWTVKKPYFKYHNNEGYRLLYYMHRMVALLFMFSLVASASNLFYWLSGSVFISVE